MIRKNSLRLIYSIFLGLAVFLPFDIEAQGLVSNMILGSFDLVGVILSPLVIALVKVVSWITMLSGVVLNASIYYTVIAMSENIGTLPAINITWTVIRDVANMGFIFMLLYSSIMTIVGKEKDTKGLIVKMVIAAILVNFSLFFTKVFIDVTNLLALTFYRSIAPGALLGEANFLNAGLSNSIIDALGTQKLWQMYGSIDSSVVLTSAVMTIIVLIITTFIFSAMAVMFIVRYVALIFVLVLSPIMFLSTVFPGLGTYAQRWKSTLIGQAVFAPVFMLMTWVTVILIRGISSTVFTGINSDSLGNALSSTSFTVGAVPTLVNYVMIIIFLIVSFTISMGVANKADANVNKFGKWALGFAGGATTGTVGWAGRKTVGWSGNRLAENANLINATKKDGIAGAGARLALYASKKAASGTYDLRNATIPTESVGDLVRGTVGRTTAGKFLGADDFRTKSIEVGKPLANQIGISAAGEKGYKELKEESKKRLDTEKNERTALLRRTENEANIDKGVEAAETVAQKTANNPGYTPTLEETAAIDAMERSMSKMSDKELEALVEGNRELIEKQSFANMISVQQLEALNKSDKLSESEKATLNNNRFKSINTEMTHLAGAPAGTPMNAAVKKSVSNLSDEELALIDPQYLRNTEFVAALKPSQVEAINKSKKFTKNQKDSLKKLRMEPLFEALRSRPVDVNTAQTILKKMSDKDRAGMMSTTLVPGGTSVLIDANVLPIYTPRMLKRMAQEMSAPDIQALRTALDQGLPATSPTRIWLLDPTKGGEDFN